MSRLDPVRDVAAGEGDREIPVSFTHGTEEDEDVLRFILEVVPKLDGLGAYSHDDEFIYTVSVSGIDDEIYVTVKFRSRSDNPLDVGEVFDHHVAHTAASYGWYCSGGSPIESDPKDDAEPPEQTGDVFLRFQKMLPQDGGSV